MCINSLRNYVVLHYVNEFARGTNLPKRLHLGLGSIWYFIFLDYLQENLKRSSVRNSPLAIVRQTSRSNVCVRFEGVVCMRSGQLPSVLSR